jgi:hypothetical protein
MTFRRREAQRAGRQTVEDLGKDGTIVSDRCISPGTDKKIVVTLEEIARRPWGA